MSVSVCIAGKNRIAINALRLACAERPGAVFALCNQTDDGEDRWQPSFRRYAQAVGVPTIDISDAYRIDNLVFLSTEFDKIVRPDLFAAGSRLYNIHFSALPAYKGMYTSAHPILNGERESGCTLHEIDPGIDTGNIVDQILFDIFENETAKSLYEKYLNNGIRLLRKNIFDIIAGSIKSTPQPVSCSSYYSSSSIDYNSLKLDVRQTCENIIRQIRAYNHRSFQLVNFQGNPISAARALGSATRKPPGTILLADDASMVIATIDYDCRLIVDRFETLLAAAAIDDIDTVDEILTDDIGLLNESNNRGWTPLIVAAFHGANETISRLISLGADPDKPNEKGTTPLMYAKDAFIRSNDATSMRHLISAGADIDASDMWGKSLIDYVDEDGQASVIAILHEGRPGLEVSA